MVLFIETRERKESNLGPTFSKQMTSRMLFLLALTVIALSWVSMHRAMQLPEKLRRAYRQREYPLPIRGLKLELLSAVATVDTGDIVPSRYPDRVLLLVSSGNCTKSRENQAHWKQLLASMPIGSIDEIWLLSLSEHEHLRLLKAYLRDASPVPLTMLRSDHRDTFGLRTGLVAAPATLLLDSEGRVQMNLVGILTQEDIRLVLTELQAESIRVSPLAKGLPHANEP